MTRIEWATVTAMTFYSAEPGEFVDDHGVQNHGPAWGVFTGSDGMVITANSADELADYLEHWAEVVRAGGVEPESGEDEDDGAT